MNRRNALSKLAFGGLALTSAWLAGCATAPAPRRRDDDARLPYVYRQGAQLALPRTTFEQARLGRVADDGELRPADLVFYNTLGRPHSHVGIYIGEERFVHAPSSRGVVRVEAMRASYWRDRFNGARRLLG